MATAVRNGSFGAVKQIDAGVPDPSVYAKKFSGPYAHRSIPGSVGHNLPQEAPRVFAQAVVDVAGD